MGIVPSGGSPSNRIARRNQNLRSDTRERQPVFNACDGIEYSAFDGSERGNGGFWRTDILDAAAGELSADRYGR